MKKIIIPFALIAALFTASSCEDFLTKSPESSLSPDSYFSSAAELELWANKFYNDILPTAGELAELSADDNGSSSSLTAIQKGTRTPSSKSWSASTWKPLRNINFLLENNKCSDLATKRMYDGVAYFFRAWFYFEKVRQYGDIPWYDHVIESSDMEDLNKPRDPRGYVMLKVMQDLDKAYELLPAKWATDPVYHVSKDAALALKYRAALFEGTFRKYHAGTEFVPVDEQTFEGITISSEWFLRQAVDAAGKMLGTRQLYTGNTLRLSAVDANASYREYFILESAETSETILSRRYSVDVMVRHGIQFDYKNQRRSASVEFTNHYLQRNGQPIQARTGYETLSYYDLFQNRDPRMSQTLQGPDFVMADFDETSEATPKPHLKEQLSWERTFNGFRVIKYISDTSHETATTSTTDFPLIRYPEVLLNYAEAKAELGELTQDDITKTIDVIRARVAMPPMTMPTMADGFLLRYYTKVKEDAPQLAALLEVRRERTVELFCEGFRQWDLLRWGEGAKLTPKATGGFHGIYIAGSEVGTDIDLDKDGKADLYIYRGTKGNSQAPATNQIQLGSGYSLSEGDHGYLTYWAAEDYEWNEGRDYLWPIPADQRTLTGFALSQNPGWDDGLSE